MAKKIDRFLLPKRDAKRILATESLNKLTRVFPEKEYVIRDEVIEDAGIDFTLEMVAGGAFTNRRINVQLKAKFKAKVNKDGTISKGIERKNLLYLGQGSNLSLYILYVEENDTYYFEWQHEFEDHLSSTVPDWIDQKKNTLHFNKVLNTDSVQDIFARVETHATMLEQFRTGLKIEDIVSSFHQEREPKYYDDIQWSILDLAKRFDGLSVFPKHLLVKLPPFSRSAESRTIFSDYDNTIYTDNQELYNFFAPLRTEDEKIFRVVDDQKEAVDMEQMKEVLKFFEFNSIHHIAMISRQTKDRICIHKLEIYSIRCNCEKCSYDRQDWTMTLNKLNSPFDNAQTYNWLRRCYVFLEFGKVKDAFELLKELSTVSRKNKNFVASFIAKFNIVSMLSIVRKQILRPENENIEREILEIDLRNEIYRMLLYGQTSREVIMVLLWLSENNYYHQLYQEIDIEFQEILRARHTDQLGGTVRKEHYRAIAKPFSELTLFSEGNAFHSGYFRGFQVNCHKMAESALILYGLKNPMALKLEGFNEYLFGICLRYGDPEQLNKLFVKYNVHPIKILMHHGDDHTTIHNKIDNLISSLGDAVSFGLKEEEADNALPIQQLNRQVHVLGILLSIMEASQESLNRNVLALIRAAIQYPVLESSILNGLRRIFFRRSSLINLDIYLELYKWIVTSGKRDGHMITLEVPYYVSDIYPEYKCVDLEINNSIRSRFKISQREERHFNSVIMAFWEIANDGFKIEIKQFVEEVLVASFVWRLNYMASVKGVIDYNLNLKKTIERIPRSENAKEASRSLLGYDDFTNDNLDQFLELAFQFNIDLKQPSIQALAGDVPYYKWLMNMDDFDYSGFDPYWVLFRTTNSYLNEYKKYPAIKHALEKELRKNPIKKLTELYFQNFC